MTTRYPENSTAPAAAAGLWPWAAFLAVVLAYGYFFLGQGFNATDEGYLQAVGQRISDGQAPFTDFYFLRTPLSAYIQAGFIALFGDDYTILVSRVIWAVQQALVVLLIAFLFRRRLSGVALAMMMTLAWASATVIMNFAWYNYDAAFFAIVAVVLLSRRRHLLAGVAAFLAGMCKQNYLLLLPLLIVGDQVLPRLWRGRPILKRQGMVTLFVGFVAPALVYGVWLAVDGRLGAFFENIFVFPRKASTVSIWFGLFQNLHIALLRALPLVLTTCLMFFHRPSRQMGAVGDLCHRDGNTRLDGMDTRELCLQYRGA